MDYGLPVQVEINGHFFDIRYDYRVVLDIFEMLNDPDLTGQEKALATLMMFYPDFQSISGADYEVAIRECFKFLNGGDDNISVKKQPKLIDWEQDYRYIVAAVNRVLGYEVRATPYDKVTNTGGVHWYTFLSAYMEIGDCYFAQIVSIRSKKAKGKKLDKAEQDFYKRNKEIINIKTRYSEAEDDIVKLWTGAK